MDRLTELIKDGPDKRYRMKSVILDRYEDIDAARKLMRTWHDIADALGFAGRGKDVAGCFTRVAAGIKKGKLAIPKKGTRPQRQPTQITSSLQKREDDEDGLTTSDKILNRIHHL